jgi:hypothetical protein
MHPSLLVSLVNNITSLKRQTSFCSIANKDVYVQVDANKVV